MHKRFVEFSTKITGEFVIQTKRWIVERTIAWLNWARRLSKDFEQKCIYLKNTIRLSAIAFDSQANPLKRVSYSISKTDGAVVWAWEVLVFFY